MVYSVFVRKHYRCNIVDSFLVVLLLNGASVVSKRCKKSGLKCMKHLLCTIQNKKRNVEELHRSLKLQFLTFSGLQEMTSVHLSGPVPVCTGIF